MNTQISPKNNLKNILDVTSKPSDKRRPHRPYAKRKKPVVPSILVLTTFPPSECGIATYSSDLIGILQSLFSNSFEIKVCPIQSNIPIHKSGRDGTYFLNPDDVTSYSSLAQNINDDDSVHMLMVQHEFGLFHQHQNTFLDFLREVTKPILIAFHTVLPQPTVEFKNYVQEVIRAVKHIVVMTKSSKELLVQNYDCKPQMISMIPHGTHLISHKNKKTLKATYGFNDKVILSTFGLLGPGKSIETSLEALSVLVPKYPNLHFLIIGKTHPGIVKNEGEMYREYLLKKIDELQLQEHVAFVNEFVPLENLLEYLQLTDIYLFTSKDPNQAVSGTFSYAMSCGCPIISTPIPHAIEFLDKDKGLLFEFGNAQLLAQQITKLLDDATHRKNLGLNSLHASVANTWENSAIAHAKLFESLVPHIQITYNNPPISFKHLKRMTTSVGMVQFSILNHPDLHSGYTLDDNARALIVVCKAYEQSADPKLLPLIMTYCNFILNCQLHHGKFLNYVNQDTFFTDQNNLVNLDDSNGRAIWALGHLISIKDYLPKPYEHLVEKAEDGLSNYLPNVKNIHSPRAIGFLIKGIALSKTILYGTNYKQEIGNLADKLAAMYRHEQDEQWKWFENSLTYGNAILPEAMLIAFEETGTKEYERIAKASFHFLLKHLFRGQAFQVISNTTWFKRGDEIANLASGGQQAIDVAYTILALHRFNTHYPEQFPTTLIKKAFSWFLGENHLQQTVYNPCTKGCYDGLEATNVNLNQGAESIVSYLLSRLTIEEIEKDEE